MPVIPQRAEWRLVYEHLREIQYQGGEYIELQNLFWIVSIIWITYQLILDIASKKKK